MRTIRGWGCARKHTNKEKKEVRRTYPDLDGMSLQAKDPWKRTSLLLAACREGHWKFHEGRLGKAPLLLLLVFHFFLLVVLLLLDLVLVLVLIMKYALRYLIQCKIERVDEGELATRGNPVQGNAARLHTRTASHRRRE